MSCRVKDIRFIKSTSLHRPVGTLQQFWILMQLTNYISNETVVQEHLAVCCLFLLCGYRKSILYFNDK